MDLLLPDIIGVAPSFVAVLDQVSRLASIERPVLVVGDRGTGKELLAGRLHYLSPRWEQPFVRVNCAALPVDLIDSELFGHEAGAFTGAARRHAGRFERADGGSLFLDEIATAPAAVQEKLLRVIEYGEYERVGGRETLKTDVRLIAATNVDLPSEAAAGRFRADLLDRLAFDVVTVPPLQSRPGDVELLATTFGQSFAGELGVDFPGFAPTALTVLKAHSWPGNVRELKNAVERTVARALELGEAPIEHVSVDPFESPYRPTGLDRPKVEREVVGDAQPDPLPSDLKSTLAAHERDLVQRALQAHRFHQGRTAEALGLTYSQLRNILKRLDFKDLRE
ncbi:MAG: phage shock protein operon transcriptional activator [Pseudomonadota bacterium]